MRRLADTRRHASLRGQPRRRTRSRFDVGAAGGADPPRRACTKTGSLRVRFPNRRAERAVEAVLVNTAGGLAGGDRFDIDDRARRRARR